MSKKLKNLKWETVALEGFPASVTQSLDGFVGLEECTNYGLDKETKKPKKKKSAKKRKNNSNTVVAEVPNKKIKLNNGFIVENCDSATPSLGNEESKSKKPKKKRKKVEKLSKVSQQKEQPKVQIQIKNSKRKLGEFEAQKENLTAEDMLSWAEFKLPEPILRAMMELGFKQPTKIQQLTLPAAIHGRRDILGAAETGSGKTLAFGLPILTGILKLKEKAAMGHDVYDLPFKKTSNKRKSKTPEQQNGRNRNKRKNNKRKQESKKESSEDGYSSGEESDVGNEQEKVEENDANIKSKDDDFIEEIEVSIRKRRESSVDEGNDSDDDNNYIHLSDMLNDDDLADSTSEEEEEVKNDVEKHKTDSEDDREVDKTEASDDGGEVDEDESETEITEQGIGCVKVIDDVEMPTATVVRTGKPLYALIVTPTRELAIQISNHLKTVAKYTGIRIATVVGGIAEVKQERVLGCGPEVVVATPGRLWEMITKGHPHLQQLDTIKFLAIDETDRMVERGHFEELLPLLERINVDPEKAATRQNFVFSATLTMVHELPAHMRGKKVTKRGKIINRKVEKMTPRHKINKLVKLIGMTEPKVVDITQQNLGTAETLTESRIICSPDAKEANLYYILKRHPGRTIVFCNTIGCVKRITHLLTILKCPSLPLHAGMPQRQRLKNLERFRDDPLGTLVSTDVAARGLDIPDVEHVIHYQLPSTAENYVHRSGRTARANKEGLTILLMEPGEAFLYTKLCRTLNKTTEVPQFPIPLSSLSPIKELISLARDIDRLELKKRRDTAAIGWREKAARDMDIIIDEDDIPMVEADAGIDKVLKAKKRQLDKLLSRPQFPRGFSFKYPTLNDPNALKLSEDNALQVMKKALESGELKKQKRKSKNAPLLKLEKEFKKKQIK